MFQVTPLSRSDQSPQGKLLLPGMEAGPPEARVLWLRDHFNCRGRPQAAPRVLHGQDQSDLLQQEPAHERDGE